MTHFAELHNLVADKMSMSGHHVASSALLGHQKFIIHIDHTICDVFTTLNQQHCNDFAITSTTKYDMSLYNITTDHQQCMLICMHVCMYTCMHVCI